MSLPQKNKKAYLFPSTGVHKVRSQLYCPQQADENHAPSKYNSTPVYRTIHRQVAFSNRVPFTGKQSGAAEADLPKRFSVNIFPSRQS